MFFRKQKEIERLSQRCLELGDELIKKNKENKKLKEENRKRNTHKNGQI